MFAFTSSAVKQAASSHIPVQFPVHKNYKRMGKYVTFGLNVRLDLSRKATTKSLSSLGAQPGFEILG